MSNFFCECKDSGEPPCAGLVQLRADLAAAQEARQLEFEKRMAIVAENCEYKERAQRAEALAESNARDAARYRWSKKLRPQPLWDGIPMKLHYMASMSEDAIDAAIDATMDAAAISAIAEGK